MSENTKPRGCGQREVIGHSQNHFCGDELWGEVVYCDSCNLKVAKARIAELEAALAAMGATQQAEARDREADRERFPDTDFNRWLDEVISDSGHIVWHQIGNIEDAWAAWDSRPYYAKGRHPLADAPEDELFPQQPAPVVPEGMVLAYGYLWHADNPSEVRGDNLVLPPEIAAAKARLELRGLLTTDQRCRAIDKVRGMLAAAQQQGEG